MSLKSDLSRRQLLWAGAAAVAAHVAMRPRRLLGAVAPDVPPARTGTSDVLYSFVVLGDLHYDAPAHHDMDWVKQKHPGDIRQIENYCAVTSEHTPRLMRRVKEAIAQSSVPVAFIAQNGDLAEGLCGSFELQSKQFQDVTGMIDQVSFGVPFLVTKGNHDITGPGAAEAYEKVLLPWISRQAGQEFKSAAYARREGDDIFVHFDAYVPDLDWLEQTLKENADARHCFFFTHPPVTPSDARADWCLFADQKESRVRLLSLLGQRRAFVFSGHLHKYSFIERETPTGTFWETGTCSVVRSDPTTPRKFAEGREQYGEQLTDLEPKFSPATLEKRKGILREEKPSIRQYELADVPGYTIVKVYADGIECETYAGTDTTAWEKREGRRGVRA